MTRPVRAVVRFSERPLTDAEWRSRLARVARVLEAARRERLARERAAADGQAETQS